jgi:hypothetical protein
MTHAQVNFPNDTIVFTIDQKISNEQYIQIDNNGADTLDYAYHIFLDEFKPTAGWSTQFCDCEACIENYAVQGMCEDLEPGDFWPFAVYVTPDSMIAGKMFSVSFINPNDSTDADTVTLITEIGEEYTEPVKTSVNEGLVADNGVSISPNPASDVISLKSTGYATIQNVSIINLTGSVVIDEQLNNQQATIDVSELPRGAYIARVTVGDQQYTQKILLE